MDKSRSNPIATQTPPRAAEGAKAGGKQAAVEKREQRTQVRYPVSAAAVVIETRSRTRMTGRASDLSLNGCYVDSFNVFPVGAAVRLRLTAEGHSFECDAGVAYSLSGMGMGLAFGRATPDQTASLRSWVAELRGDPGSADSSDFGFDEGKPSAPVQAGGWQDAMSELISVLIRKGLIDEADSNSLRKKLR